MSETRPRSLGQEGSLEKGKRVQYCCLENPMDRGAWQAVVRGVRQECVTNTFTSLFRMISISISLTTKTLFQNSVTFMGSGWPYLLGVTVWPTAAKQRGDTFPEELLWGKKGDMCELSFRHGLCEVPKSFPLIEQFWHIENTPWTWCNNPTWSAPRKMFSGQVDIHVRRKIWAGQKNGLDHQGKVCESWKE